MILQQIMHNNICQYVDLTNSIVILLVSLCGMPLLGQGPTVVIVSIHYPRMLHMMYVKCRELGQAGVVTGR